MTDATVFDRIRKKTAPFFRHSHHDLYHVERVYNLALRLAHEEGADLDTVKAAVLLHDVARAQEDEGKIKDHAKEGARMARKILTEVDFPKNKIDGVVKCVEVHRFRNRAMPKSLEAKILQDADRLDILGAIGIARVFTRAGWNNQPIYDSKVLPKKNYDGKSETAVNHIYEKLLKVKETMNTAAARKLAEERHKYIEQFVERLLREWNGEI